MNQYAGPTPTNPINRHSAGSPDGDADIRLFATLNPDADVPDSGDDEDEEPMSTGLNPDPDYEKLAGSADLMLPDAEDDDDLSSEDTEDDR